MWTKPAAVLIETTVEQLTAPHFRTSERNDIFRRLGTIKKISGGC
jgi:hypothetical protein